MWRYLSDIGMALHKRSPPRASPINPDFKLKIPSTIATSKGDIQLVFYTPRGYSKPNHKNGQRPDKKYSVILNFHRGGFTICRASDDVVWARAVNAQVDAVVISVEYRLAPEYPFPTAVEDGVDAVLYVMDHADELGLDANRIGLSGFSAGGNMAFSVPLKLHEELNRRKEAKMKSVDENENGDSQELRRPSSSALENGILVTCSWYPSLDYTRSRDNRRKTSIRPDKNLPKFFTDLFDASYLYPTSSISLDSPYLSPGVAPTPLLQAALPHHILLYTCEWDQLLSEGEDFRRRLEGEVGGREVRYVRIGEAVHGFDRSPNPFWRDPRVDMHYRDACKKLREVFYGND